MLVTLARCVSKAKPTLEQLGALGDTLAWLKGLTLDEKHLKRNALRVFANWQFIREGVPIPEWDGTPDTAEVYVLGVARLKPKAGADRLMLTVKLKSGLGAGIIQCGLLYRAAIETFLDHRAGCSNMQCTAEEISGMLFMATVTFDGTLLHFADLQTTERQRKHNKELTARRSDPQRCRRGIPCNVCEKTVAECPLAVWRGKNGSKVSLQPDKEKG